MALTSDGANGEDPDDVFSAAVTVSLPDLEVPSVTPAMASAEFGQTIQVDWLMRNADPVAAAAGDWTDRIWLSTDTTLMWGRDIHITSKTSVLYTRFVKYFIFSSGL